jgi:hypothetical protein
MTGTEPHAWEMRLMDNITYVGLDVHKVCFSTEAGPRQSTAARY